MAPSPSLGRESVPCDRSPIERDKLTTISNKTLPPNSATNNVDIDNDLRRQVGRLVVDTQQTIDSNLSLFRMGFLVTLAASIAVSVRLSGLLNRVNNVDEIPSWQFMRRKKLRVRMIRQSRQDPSVFYVYHTPFLRRTVLQDKLPDCLTVSIGDQKSSDLIAVRPFGVQVDESSEEWVWSNFVSSHRSLTIQLLRRIKVIDSESVALCNIALKRPPMRKDFAQELVSYGYAECIPENLKNYENGSNTAISSLLQRLKNLEAAQKHAQTMQYGIWKNWQENKLSDRVFSASKRATAKGLKKLINSIYR
ncbi:unnamed protein product [Peronospora belbahrii]|uniref:TNase-like domain-containing protein n=1 Tax=Peronospora belbahrii TaxID=622444 RepID=A0AAU9KLB5_9STRA|nr:unnamed protein product [Peronospora belbahrii]